MAIGCIWAISGCIRFFLPYLGNEGAVPGKNDQER
jgi:hypothetical protein